MSQEPHHLAWLEGHPHRSPEWLASQLRDGFDVHHLDGDHANNDPRNLVLIEHTDHMAIHGGWMLGRLEKRPTVPKGGKHRRKRKIDIKKVEAAVRQRVMAQLAATSAPN